KSEQQLQRELELSRGRRRICNLARRLAIAVVGAVALEDNLVRKREINVIQNIKRFRAELQRHALPDRNPLNQGRVDVEPAPAAERTPSNVPERAGCRHREGTRIEPVFNRPQNHWALKVRTQVRYVDQRSVAGAGAIETDQRRERKSTLSGDDSIPLPAPNQTVHPPADAAAKALPAPERQLIAEVRIELVCEVVSGDTFVQMAIVGTEKVRRLVFARRRQDGRVHIQHLRIAVIRLERQPARRALKHRHIHGMITGSTPTKPRLGVGHVWIRALLESDTVDDYWR